MKKVGVALFALVLAACGDFSMEGDWSIDTGSGDPFDDVVPGVIVPNDPGTGTPNVPASEKSLVVNEVFFHVEGAPGDASRDGSALPNDQFLEIRNVSADPVSLDGVEIWESDETVPRLRFEGPITLGPGRALMIFGGGPSLVGGDVTCGTGYALVSRELRLDLADRVRILRGTDVLDEVEWTSAPANVSLTRLDYGSALLLEHALVSDRFGSLHRWSPGCGNDDGQSGF